MLSLFATLFAMSTAATAAALPNPQTGTQPYPNETAVYYYQGTETDNGVVTSCGYNVVNGTISADVCTVMTTAGIGIQELEIDGCSFTLWTGVTNCEGGQMTEYALPNGDGSQCFYTGVLDGGKFYHASAIWSCD